MLKINGLITVSLLGLTACGGSGGGSSAVVTNGVFKDSNVSGLSYESGDQKGITNELGAFKYEEGTDVSFNVGGVSLGSGKGKSVMTPLDLVTNGQLATPEVINRVRFLMMLDKDNMPSNGIEISDKVQEKAMSWEAVDFAATDFPNQALNSIVVDSSVEDAVSHALPDAAVATAHLRSTLLCANAGVFKGSYSGSESGTIAFIVDPVTGEVNGSSYNPDNEVSVEVKNTVAIDYDSGLAFVSAEDSAKAFSGTLQSSDDIDGTWSNTSDTTSNGSFEAARFGSKSDSTFRYAASFIGDAKGVFTFNVDASNNVTGTVYSVSTGEESNLNGNISAENKLTATSDDGDEITGFIDPDTLAFTSGAWINGQQQSTGSFTGGGCRLN
ncbi:MAG: hypothetical protein ACI88H_002194 [Cocleimonas sp.]|jgi:hypothetical protein